MKVISPASMIARRQRLAMACACCALSPLAMAMQGLSDDELSTVNGQDGIEAALTALSQVDIAQMRLESDAGASAGGLMGQGMRLAPSGVLGDPTSLGLYWSMDVGADTQAATLPAIDVQLNMSRARLGGQTANNGWVARMNAEPSRSFGQWALVSDLQFRMSGLPFYGAPSSTARMNLQLNDANLFYRQNGPSNASLALADLDFVWLDPTATVDADAGGLRLASAVGGAPAYFAIDFDARYKFSGIQDMTTITSADRPLVRFSWGGNLYDSTLYLRSGGLWDTSTDSGTNVAFNVAGTGLVNKPITGLTEGISVGMRWNYRDALGNNNFLWGIGNIEGDQEFLEFADWKNLEQATGPVPNRYGFDFPLIVIDALDAGGATNAGGSLCWGNTMTGAACSAGGGTLLNLRAGTVEGYNGEVNRTGGATAVHLIRNGNLLAWSNSIKVKRNPAAPVTELDKEWGIIYTFGNINSNVYVYPGGSESDALGGSRADGVIMDVLMMTQSFGDWQNNYVPGPYTNTTRWSGGTHFLLADVSPAAQMGIGFLGSSFLIAADDLRIWLRNTTSGQAYPFNWDGGIDLYSPRTRANMVTLFGGARLPNGRDLVRGAYIDMNLEGAWNFRISPPPLLATDDETNDFLAWSAALRLRCGTTVRPGCSDNAFTDSAGSTIASGSGSYLSIAEPSFPDVDLRIGDVNGDVAWTQGVLQLRSTNDTIADNAPGSPADIAGKPELVLASKLLIGASAGPRLSEATVGSSIGSGGAAGRPLTANVTFGGNDMWSIAMPAGSFYSSFTLMPQ